MKREPELIREILLRVEALPAGKSLSRIEVDEYDRDTIGEHVRLLTEANYIEAHVSVSFGQHGAHQVKAFSIVRLLNEGHDFLANAKSDSIWKKANNLVQEKTGDVSLAVLKAVLAKVAAQTLGL